VQRLRGDGHRVVALVRDGASADALTALGAEPVFGDLTETGAWQHDARAADAVWHTAMPRVAPPLRSLGVARRARAARAMAQNLHACIEDGQTVAVASSALVYGHRPGVATHEDAPQRPVAMGRIATASEQALADAGCHIVRIGWIYGRSGLGDALTRGLAQRRFRIVGDGDNRWPLISAADAASALVAAVAAPVGTYTAAEADAPTQQEVVAEICSQAGYPRPDRLPHALAALPLGGQLAAALATSLELPCQRLRDRGWRPADDWRRDLLSRCQAEA
jgi:nucleoside-diphosphate-sugar epimerase